MSVKVNLFRSNIAVFIISFLLIAALVSLINSKLYISNPGTLSTFVTLDFIITIPVIYFLLIRKTKISKISLAPFLIGSTVLASYVIPSEHQSFLKDIKAWLIPVIEIGVLTIVFLKVRSGIKQLKTERNNYKDVYDLIHDTSYLLFPKRVGRVIANEMALLYYGFCNFKTTNLNPNEFSNYKGSGILSTLGALIFVIAVEMVTIHILVAKWNVTIAWILTFISMYSAFQIIGIIRSVPKRPIQIHSDYILLRFGILSETKIPLTDIESIAIAQLSDFDKDKRTKTMSLLGELEHSNIVIQLKKPHELKFMYGKPKAFTKLLCFVDDNQTFKSEVEALLKSE